MKYCPKCETDKDKSEFHKSNQTKDGLKGWCKTCTNAYNAQREKENPRDRSAYYGNKNI